MGLHLFRRKKRDELEKNPKKYIETLFHFLEDRGFQVSHRQVNCESWFDYEKDDFHVDINYGWDRKKPYAYFDVYYKMWDDDGIMKHLYIEDGRYKLRFRDYDRLSCKEQLDLVAEYLSAHIDDVMQANMNNSLI